MNVSTQKMWVLQYPHDSSREYSRRLTPRVPRVGFESTATLTSMKRSLKMNEWMFLAFTQELTAGLSLSLITLSQFPPVLKSGIRPKSTVLISGSDLDYAVFLPATSFQMRSRVWKKTSLLPVTHGSDETDVKAGALGCLCRRDVLGFITMTISEAVQGHTAEERRRVQTFCPACGSTRRKYYKVQAR